MEACASAISFRSRFCGRESRDLLQSFSEKELQGLPIGLHFLITR